MTDLTVVILSYNTKNLTIKCLESIFKYKWIHKIKIILVDNASDDQTAESIKEKFPEVELILSKNNLGFSGGNNLALKVIDSKYSLLLNSDTQLTKDSLDSLIDFMESNKFIIGSCKLLNLDGSLQANAGDLPTPLAVLSWLSGIDDIINKLIIFPTFHAKSKLYYRNEKEVGWVSGAVMMIRMNFLNQVGLLDENIFMYDEDVDLCLRVNKLGGKIGWTDRTYIFHTGGGSSDKPLYNQWLNEFKNLKYLYTKHYGIIYSLILNLLIELFIILRIIGYIIIGKFDYSKTYAQILFKI